MGPSSACSPSVLPGSGQRGRGGSRGLEPPEVTHPSLQVTEEVQRLLRPGGYHFLCRGKVSVKGKGEMLTYFLEGRTDGNSQTRPPNLERKLCPYRRAGHQTSLATGCPPASMVGLPVGAGLGAPQGLGLTSRPPGPHPPPGVAGKEA